MTVLPLAGKVAIVTGAGRGLGRSMARGLTRAGAKVVLTAARAKNELDAAAAEIVAERGEAAVAAMLADVVDPDACEAVVARALDRFGRLDVLVSNAGRGMKYVSENFMTEPPRFWEITAETWQMVIATNVNGPFLMARAAVPHFLKAGKGRIINISMNWQTMRRKGFTPYGPSKAALNRPYDLGAGPGRHGHHRQHATAGRCDGDRHDFRRCPGRGAGDAARPRRHRTAPYLASLRRLGRRDRQAHHRHRMESRRSEDGGCRDNDMARGGPVPRRSKELR